MRGKCDVCSKEDEVFVGASTMGAISFAYCKECLQKGLEPYWAMVSYIACAGRFPDDINEMYRSEVRHILEGLNKTEDEFIKDIDHAIFNMDEYYSQIEHQDFE